MASYIDKRQSGRIRDGRSLSQATVTYAASITLTAADLAAEEALIKISPTGALTLIAPTTDILDDQIMILALTCDTTSREVTFSTGFQTTKIVNLKKSETTMFEFRFNGTAWVNDRRHTHLISGTAYGATLAIAAASLNHDHTIYAPAALTGALTLNITAVTSSKIGDRLTVVLTCDTTSRQVTFGTNFQTAHIVQLPLSEATVFEFYFNGTAFVGSRAPLHVISGTAYAATLAIAAASLNHDHVVYAPATLTGDLTLNLTAVTSSKTGDKLTVLLLSDGTGRLVTFGTNIATVGTLQLVASKRGSCSFMFDGTKYVETGRAIEA